LLAVSENWQERLSMMEAIYDFYRDYIISHSLLPELDFNRVDLVEMPLHENEFNNAKNILDNPDFLAEVAAKKEKAVRLGFGPDVFMWVDWWQME
jgi:hypothetical protein